jgi:hypothetical protein
MTERLKGEQLKAAKFYTLTRSDDRTVYAGHADESAWAYNLYNALRVPADIHKALPLESGKLYRVTSTTAPSLLGATFREFGALFDRVKEGGAVLEMVDTYTDTDGVDRVRFISADGYAIEINKKYKESAEKAGAVAYTLNDIKGVNGKDSRGAIVAIIAPMRTI